MGLYLVRGIRRTDDNGIVVEARPGTSQGTLHRLVPGAHRVGEVEVEPHGAIAALEPGGTLHRWDAADLEDGVYVVTSVGEALEEIEIFFEITAGELRRDFGGDRKRAERELRRRS